MFGSEHKNFCLHIFSSAAEVATIPLDVGFGTL